MTHPVCGFCGNDASGAYVNEPRDDGTTATFCRDIQACLNRAKEIGVLNAPDREDRL